MRFSFNAQDHPSDYPLYGNTFVVLFSYFSKSACLRLLGLLFLSLMILPPSSWATEVETPLKTEGASEVKIEPISGLSPDFKKIESKKPDMVDDYIQRIFSSPVPSRLSPAEAAFEKELQQPGPLPFKDTFKAAMKSQSGYGTRFKAGVLASENSYFNSRMLLWPMRTGMVTSRYGPRWGKMHKGTDISAPYGSPILAAGQGKVIFSGWETGYGKLVIVDHGKGIKTKYGHCSSLMVAVGQAVQQGQIIGHVGSTGHSTGPHLHYEVVRDGMNHNPEIMTTHPLSY
jgi:murein DD-endopeptidase MepM/ murein hydrolase activator NlpD